MSTQTAQPLIWLALVSTRCASPGGSVPLGTAADVALRRFTNSCRILELLKSMREAAGARSIDPEHEAVLAESVGLALYVVMDALTPAERVSFVLHDVFEIPFDTIAAILGRSTATGASVVGAEEDAGLVVPTQGRGVLSSRSPIVRVVVGVRGLLERFS